MHSDMRLLTSESPDQDMIVWLRAMSFLAADDVGRHAEALNYHAVAGRMQRLVDTVQALTGARP